MSKKKKNIKPTKEDGFRHFLTTPQFAVTRGAFYMLLAFFAFVATLSFVFKLFFPGDNPEWHRLVSVSYCSFKVFALLSRTEQRNRIVLRNQPYGAMTAVFPNACGVFFSGFYGSLQQLVGLQTPKKVNRARWVLLWRALWVPRLQGCFTASSI